MLFFPTGEFPHKTFISIRSYIPFSDQLCYNGKLHGSTSFVKSAGSAFKPQNLERLSSGRKRASQLTRLELSSLPHLKMPFPTVNRWNVPEQWPHIQLIVSLNRRAAKSDFCWGTKDTSFASEPV